MLNSVVSYAGIKAVRSADKNGKGELRMTNIDGGHKEWRII